MKQAAHLILWDEIGYDVNMHSTNDGDVVVMLTRGDDEKLKRELLNVEMGRDLDDDSPYGEDDVWQITSILHGPNTTTVEHRINRNHMGVSLIIWT
jgi:hypothetical protein